VKAPDLRRLSEFHCPQPHLAPDPDASRHRARCERGQGRADRVSSGIPAILPQPWSRSRRWRAGKPTASLPSCSPVRAERCAAAKGHLAFSAKSNSQLLRENRRGGSFLCTWLMSSLSSFQGSESQEAFYTLIFLFSTQVYFSHMLPAVWASHPGENIPKSFPKQP